MNNTFLVVISVLGAVLFVASHVWIYLRVLSPLRRLASQAQALSEGRLDSFEQPCGGVNEIQQLRRAMAGMVAHVRRAQEQSRAYTDRLAYGQETERKRIARELHDDTVQSVIAVTQSVDLARSWIESDPKRAAAMLAMAREQAVGIVNGLRQLIGGLRPPALEELGLSAALQLLVDKTEQPPVRLTVEGPPRRLEEAQELALFRVAQEALSNVIRHSAATEARVHLHYKNDGVTLAIRDNGRGFQAPAELADLAFRQHYGLLGIQERVNALGGHLGLTSSTQQGTILQVTLPVDGKRQPEHLVRDPVCSAMIEPQQAYNSMVYGGTRYYFCCPVCQGAFQKEPERYHAAEQSPA